MDNPVTVHDINELTVVASESYKDFVAGLQKEISESLSARPRKASEEYFTGKVLKTATGDVSGHAAAWRSRSTSTWSRTTTSTTTTQSSAAYHEAKKEGTLRRAAG